MCPIANVKQKNQRVRRFQETSVLPRRTGAVNQRNAVLEIVWTKLAENKTQLLIEQMENGVPKHFNAKDKDAMEVLKEVNLENALNYSQHVQKLT
jgi:hypothetical protein